MDRGEKLQYEQNIEQYFDKHKVYDLFEKLMKDIIINKPDKPIDYLIERIKRKETKRIFITGYPGTDRKDLSLAVSGAMGYSCLSLDHILEREISKKLENAHQIEKNYNRNMLVDDEIVLELVRNQLIKYEEENVSYIIEGFPRNRVQAIFLQSIGLLPDNIIVLKTSREKAEEKVYQKLKEKKVLNMSDEQLQQIAKQSIDETELNINAVKEVFEGFFCELPVDHFGSSSEVVDEIAKLLKFKNKTNAARRPPRIVLVAPPCSGKESMVIRLAKKLQITHVSVIDLLKKEIGLKNENSQAILTAINNGECVPDKYVLKLLEDRLFCSDCMINGWIVTGFPRSSSQINYMENMNPAIKPSLLVVIDMEEKMIVTKAEDIIADPLTGMMYRKDSKKYSKLGEDILKRLAPKIENQGDCLKKRIESWKGISEVLLQKNCLKLNGEEKKKRLVQLIEDAIGYNS